MCSTITETCALEPRLCNKRGHCSEKPTHMRVQLFATPWTVAYQAPPSVGFSGQEYRSGLSFPSPEDLPDPGTEPRSPTLQANALLSEPPGTSICKSIYKKVKCKEVKKYWAHCGSLTSLHSFLPPVVYPPQHCREVNSVGSGMRLIFQLHHLFTADRG